MLRANYRRSGIIQFQSFDHKIAKDFEAVSKFTEDTQQISGEYRLRQL
jgi:hypothetical protein